MKEETYVPQSPAFGKLFSDIAMNCASGHIQALVNACRDYLHDLPRWRWLKRYHVERQLALFELALVAYTFGMRRGSTR